MIPMRTFLVCLLFVAVAAAQTVKVTTPAEPEVVTITLAFENSDPGFRPTACFWYTPLPKNQRLLVHTGCAPFDRQYGVGNHQMIMVVNGHSEKFPELLDQRSELVTINLRSRFDVHHDLYRPENLQDLQK
jgi:hypothetical protein